MSNLDLHTNTSTTEWKKYNILIVDDEPGVLEQIETLLKLNGFLVSTAPSGEEGLRMLEELPAKVVVSDQRMEPGMAGTEFLAQVKERDPNVVTMILSAYSDSEYVLDAVNKAGAFQYILKPWTKEEFIQRISQALQFYHANAERRRLAQANRRLIEKIALMDNFSLMGDFSYQLHERFYPFLEVGLERAREKVLRFGPGTEEKCQAIMDQDPWYNLAGVVSRLGQLAALYHQKPEFQTESVQSVVQDCIREARLEAETSNVSVEFSEEYDEELPEMLIHTQTFTYAVRAIIENAIIFNRRRKDDGPRKIIARVYRADDSEPTARIDIQDDGPGVTQADKAFTPLRSTFAQEASPELKLRDLGRYNFGIYNHVGLGLPVARWCVTQHDGLVNLVESDEPGALFRIEMRLDQTDLRQRLGLA